MGKRRGKTFASCPELTERKFMVGFYSGKSCQSKVGLDGVFVFSPPQSNREEKNLIVLYESETGLELPNSVASGKERKQTPIILGK